VTRRLKIYLPPIVALLAIVLPIRTSPEFFPPWFVLYVGDFLCAMLIFFLYRLLFNLKTSVAFSTALVTTYLIEITQLFHPPWLEQLRSIKFFGLLLGYGFLWSDIVTYTLGILLAALGDRFINRAFDENPFSQENLEKAFGRPAGICRYVHYECADKFLAGLKEKNNTIHEKSTRKFTPKQLIGTYPDISHCDHCLKEFALSDSGYYSYWVINKT